jgi:hypothetical protein
VNFPRWFRLQAGTIHSNVDQLGRKLHPIAAFGSASFPVCWHFVHHVKPSVMFDVFARQEREGKLLSAGKDGVVVMSQLQGTSLKFVKSFDHHSSKVIKSVRWQHSKGSALFASAGNDRSIALRDTRVEGQGGLQVTALKMRMLFPRVHVCLLALLLFMESNMGARRTRLQSFFRILHLWVHFCSIYERADHRGCCRLRYQLCRVELTQRAHPSRIQVRFLASNHL